MMLLAVAALLMLQQTEDSLARTLGMAGRYVAEYRTQVSGVVYEERYRQRAEREIAPPAYTRELRSDMLLVSDRDRGWVEFRDVFEVDGRPVRDREKRLEQLFLSPGVDAFAQAERILREGARHHLNHPDLIVQRSINMPLTVLQYLMPEHQDRFRFVEDARESVNGRAAVRLRFEEHAMPRIIRTPDDAPASGRVWLDPESGAVLRTELLLVTGGTARPLSIYVSVTFTEDPKSRLLLPSRMEEEFKRGGIRVSGRAQYSNFRRFGVETNTEIKKSGT